jgi:hypothetical protein
MEETSFFNILINSLAFPFKDPDWLKKSAIGFALVLAMYVIPIVPMLFIAGYGSRIMKRILVEEGKPYLPEWDNWEGLLTDGGKLWGAGIIYALPILLLLFLGFGLMLLAILSPPVNCPQRRFDQPAGLAIPDRGVRPALSGHHRTKPRRYDRWPSPSCRYQPYDHKGEFFRGLCIQ